MGMVVKLHMAQVSTRRNQAMSKPLLACAFAGHCGMSLTSFSSNFFRASRSVMKREMMPTANMDLVMSAAEKPIVL